jgi:hypothetical protein
MMIPGNYVIHVGEFGLCSVNTSAAFQRLLLGRSDLQNPYGKQHDSDSQFQCTRSLRLPWLGFELDTLSIWLRRIKNVAVGVTITGEDVGSVQT